MKTIVRCSCGHEMEINVFGTQAERVRRIRWYEDRGVCPSCYAQNVAEQNEKAKSEHSLPDLTGSEKQIAWAERIRTSFAKIAENREKEIKTMCENSLAANPDSRSDCELLQRLFSDFCAEFFGETSASKWIDRRDDATDYDFRKISQNYIADHAKEAR